MDREDWVVMLEDGGRMQEGEEGRLYAPGRADVGEEGIWWVWRVRFGDASWFFNKVDEGDLDGIEVCYSRQEYLL